VRLTAGCLRCPKEVQSVLRDLIFLTFSFGHPSLRESVRRLRFSVPTCPTKKSDPFPTEFTSAQMGEDEDDSWLDDASSDASATPPSPEREAALPTATAEAGRAPDTPEPLAKTRESHEEVGFRI